MTMLKVNELSNGGMSMSKGTRRAVGAAIALAALGIYGLAQAQIGLPDALYLSSGQTHVVKVGFPLTVSAEDGAVQVIASGDEHLGDVALEATGAGESVLTFSLMGVPVHKTQVSVADERMLIPGGQAVGVALKTRGVLVISKAETGRAKSPLRTGDVIVDVEGEAVESAAELSACVAKAEGDTVALGVLRGGKEITVDAKAQIDPADGKRRLGIWVRDSTAGVGTLSYIDPATNAYGALGHAIVDADTGSMLSAQDGAIMSARVVGVTKGQSGAAGELKGSFLKENHQIGTLESNSEYGIYGVMDEMPGALLYPDGLPIGSRSAVHTGSASIIATVDGDGPKEYAIEIVKCFAQDEPSQKGMVIRVTDEALLSKTGGIVQGMSGSPIIQDGRIVGAVTHVVVSDSAQGYGMYIEWMLMKSDAVTAGEA